MGRCTSKSRYNGPSTYLEPGARGFWEADRRRFGRAPDPLEVALEQEPRPVRLRIDLAYDGSGFSGWAAQPGRRTVEDVLAEGLGRVLRLPAPPDLTVAGRTDAGVHARGQVVHADVSSAAWMPLASQGAGPLARLAAVLPADVRVHAVGPAPAGVDARVSALWRRYSYRVCDDPARDALGVPAAGPDRHERGGAGPGRRARLRCLLPPPRRRDHHPGAAGAGLAPGRGRRRGRHRGRRRVLPQHGARAGRRAARRRRGAPAARLARRGARRRGPRSRGPGRRAARAVPGGGRLPAARRTGRPRRRNPPRAQSFTRPL